MRETCFCEPTPSHEPPQPGIHVEVEYPCGILAAFARLMDLNREVSLVANLDLAKYGRQIESF
jgi:hypothetical protein